MILGLCFEKGGFRAALLNGSKPNPVLVSREKYRNPDSGNPALSANWFDSCFDDLMKKFKPSAISSKIYYDYSKQDDVLNHGIPMGVISLVSHREKTPLSLYTKIKLKSPKSFDLPKGSDPYVWVDALNDSKPYWDTATRDSILAAVAEL